MSLPRYKAIPGQFATPDPLGDWVQWAEVEPVEGILRRIVMGWDTGDDLDFLAAVVAARKHLGFTLTDPDEQRDDEAILLANGYAPDGERI